MTKRSLFNFDKDIKGFNVTERGVKSYSRRVKLGPFQLNLNVRKSGLRASVSIPGTGLSKQNIPIINFK